MPTTKTRTAALAGLVLAGAWESAARTAADPASDAEVKSRVEALLGQMTLDEKVGQLTLAAGAPFFGGPGPEDLLRKGAAGSILWLNDTRRFGELQRIAVEESRLKIPVLYGLDVIHGYRTIFPVPLALAASWDPSVHERAAAVAAREARAAGIHWTFAPMVDVARDARWGRIVEGAGEDPFLGAAMAAAQVRGSPTCSRTRSTGPRRASPRSGRWCCSATRGARCRFRRPCRVSPSSARSPTRRPTPRARGWCSATCRRR